VDHDAAVTLHLGLTAPEDRGAEFVISVSSHHVINVGLDAGQKLSGPALLKVIVEHLVERIQLGLETVPTLASDAIDDCRLLDIIPDGGESLFKDL
jgi:hypothetical protein